MFKEERNDLAVPGQVAAVSLPGALVLLAPRAETRIGVARPPGKKALATSLDHRRRMLEHLTRQTIQPAPQPVSDAQLRIRLIGEAKRTSGKPRTVPKRRRGASTQGKLPL